MLPGYSWKQQHLPRKIEAPHELAPPESNEVVCPSDGETQRKESHVSGVDGGIRLTVLFLGPAAPRYPVIVG